jgi:hypothetical protein
MTVAAITAALAAALDAALAALAAASMSTALATDLAPAIATYITAAVVPDAGTATFATATLFDTFADAVASPPPSPRHEDVGVRARVVRHVGDGAHDGGVAAFGRERRPELRVERRHRARHLLRGRKGRCLRVGSRHRRRIGAA